MEDYSTLSGLVGGIAVFGIILIVLLIAFAVVLIIANWKMFRKGGWECIVPVYGYWVLTEIAGLEWWWFLLAIADSILSILGIEYLAGVANLVSLFASFNIYYNIARRFNKDKGISVLAGIFSGIFILIFGFSKKEVYNSNIHVSKNGILGTPEGGFNNNNTGSNQDDNSQSSENGNLNNAQKDYSFCGNCGTKLDRDVKFCPNCGKENN